MTTKIKGRTPTTRRKKAPTANEGHTVIDRLIARAGVRCVLGLDYSKEIALASRLANFAERRGQGRGGRRNLWPTVME